MANLTFAVTLTIADSSGVSARMILVNALQELSHAVKRGSNGIVTDLEGKPIGSWTIHEN